MVSVELPPGVVTTTSLAPAVPAGVVIVIEVAVLPVIVAAAPPMVTEVAPARSVPEMTTPVVPPAVGPVLGLMLVAEGTVTYVKALVSVELPPGVVTTTSLAPAVPAGVVIVIEVAVLPVIVAAAPPMVTDVALARSVPEITTPVVPPAVGPDEGLMLVADGAVT